MTWSMRPAVVGPADVGQPGRQVCAPLPAEAVLRGQHHRRLVAAGGQRVDERAGDDQVAALGERRVGRDDGDRKHTRHAASIRYGQIPGSGLPERPAHSTAPDVPESELDEHVAAPCAAPARGRRADGAGGVAELDRHAELTNRAGNRVLGRDDHRPLDDLRVRVDLGQIADGAARHARRLELGQPLRRRPGPQPLDEQRAELAARRHPVPVGPEARVVGERVEAEHAAEGAPELVVAGRDDQVAVGRLQRLVRRDRRVPVAQARRGRPGGEVDAGLVGEQRGDGVEHPDVDELPAARAVAGEERHRDPVGREHAGRDVRDGDAEPIPRPVVGAGDAHQAPLALQHRVVPRLAPPGAGLAESGDGAEDEVRAARGQVSVAEPHAVEGAGPEVLDQHVGAGDQGVEHAAAVRVLQVQGHALLVPVDAEEVGALPLLERRPPGARVVPLAGLLDLDDAGAHVGQHHRAVGARQDAGQVEHRHPVEGSGRDVVQAGVRAGGRGFGFGHGRCSETRSATRA